MESDSNDLNNNIDTLQCDNFDSVNECCNHNNNGEQPLEKYGMGDYVGNQHDSLEHGMVVEDMSDNQVGNDEKNISTSCPQNTSVPCVVNQTPKSDCLGGCDNKDNLSEVVVYCDGSRSVSDGDGEDGSDFVDSGVVPGLEEDVSELSMNSSSDPKIDNLVESVKSDVVDSTEFIINTVTNSIIDDVNSKRNVVQESRSNLPTQDDEEGSRNEIADNIVIEKSNLENDVLQSDKSLNMSDKDKDAETQCHVPVINTADEDNVPVVGKNSCADNDGKFNIDKEISISCGELISEFDLISSHLPPPSLESPQSLTATTHQTTVPNSELLSVNAKQRAIGSSDIVLSHHSACSQEENKNNDDDEKEEEEGKEQKILILSTPTQDSTSSTMTVITSAAIAGIAGTTASVDPIMSITESTTSAIPKTDQTLKQRRRIQSSSDKSSTSPSRDQLLIPRHNSSPNVQDTFFDQSADPLSPPPPPTSPSTLTTPCPPSPHLRVRFAIGNKTKQKRLPQDLSDATKLLNSVPLETDSSESTTDTSLPQTTAETSHSPHSHHRSRFSKIGGCFCRIGSFGKKRKRNPDRDEELDGDFKAKDCERHDLLLKSEQEDDSGVKKLVEGDASCNVDEEDNQDGTQITEQTKLIDNDNNASMNTSSTTNNSVNVVETNVNAADEDAEGDEENNVDSKRSKSDLLELPEAEAKESSEEMDTVDPFKFSRTRIQHNSFRFRRAFSQKTRMKPLLENSENDDDVADDLNAVQFTAAADASENSNLGRRSGTFHRRALSLKRHFKTDTSSSHSSMHQYSPNSNNAPSSRQNATSNNSSDNSSARRHPHTTHHHHHRQNHSLSFKDHIMSFFVNLHGNDRASPFIRTGSVNKHSLASVELSTWASRGSSRRSGALAPFSSSLHPLGGVTTRAEILQTISSAIIHLFQRKRLKENELGLLQEHVRFLIETEAGGLIYDYYKDQLLRKGMVILREKIKNEQGLELLTMLSETWDYFFREILPHLQAILYPLTPVLANDESIRSLSLLAFRNIVVLKVSTREALDSVDKRSIPPSIQQMLLILQGITDNVFLSENQFLLEKLVARVVCPYMGQRGVYEGGPEPVIKVKLKPLPLNIPLNSPSTSARGLKLDHPKPTIPHSSKNKNGQIQDGSDGVKKLKPVFEHLSDSVGRRHSLVP